MKEIGVKFTPLQHLSDNLRVQYYYSVLKMILFLAFFWCPLSVLLLLWWAYRRLDTRRAGILTACIFFLAGLSWESGLKYWTPGVSRGYCHTSTVRAETSGKNRRSLVWNVSMLIAGGKPFPCKMLVQERTGQQFAGLGRDNAGLFSFQGVFSETKISFVKQYDRESIQKHRAIRAPIYFEGVVGKVKDRSIATGNFTFLKIHHCGRKPAEETVVGTWQGDLGEL